ncbi:MAG: hypothetical protein GTN43_07405, partial [Candidatus Aenigmarchaeota archaeon]|nr:hypothetical protein [Candidatus Aenigmarchaeota archaeon]
DLTQEWVKKRIALFNKFTLPSLLNQTFQDFKIFVICGNKHKKYTSRLKWNKRITLCYGRGESGTILTAPGYPKPGLEVKEFEGFDTDYIAITRLDSDDMFHRTAMEDVRDGVERILPTENRQCLIFRKYIVWDRINQYIRPVHHKPSPPFITHIFPKSIYKDYETFASQHFVNHRFMGGRDAVELSTDKVCVVNHEENISRVKRNRELEIMSKERRKKFKADNPSFIYGRQEMFDTLRDFSINRKDVDGDGGF